MTECGTLRKKSLREFERKNEREKRARQKYRKSYAKQTFGHQWSTFIYLFRRFLFLIFLFNFFSRLYVLEFIQKFIHIEMKLMIADNAENVYRCVRCSFGSISLFLVSLLSYHSELRNCPHKCVIISIVDCTFRFKRLKFAQRNS